MRKQTRKSYRFTGRMNRALESFTYTTDYGWRYRIRAAYLSFIDTPFCSCHTDIGCSVHEERKICKCGHKK